MKLKDARICLNDDCEEVFEGARCPACASGWFFPIEAWLNRDLESQSFRAGQPASAEGSSQPSLEGTD